MLTHQNVYSSFVTLFYRLTLSFRGTRTIRPGAISRASRLSPHCTFFDVPGEYFLISPVTLRHCPALLLYNELLITWKRAIMCISGWTNVMDGLSVALQWSGGGRSGKDIYISEIGTMSVSSRTEAAFERGRKLSVAYGRSRNRSKCVFGAVCGRRYMCES